MVKASPNFISKGKFEYFLKRSKNTIRNSENTVMQMFIQMMKCTQCLETSRKTRLKQGKCVEASFVGLHLTVSKFALWIHNVNHENF